MFVPDGESRNTFHRPRCAAVRYKRLVLYCFPSKTTPSTVLGFHLSCASFRPYLLFEDSITGGGAEVASAGPEKGLICPLHGNGDI